MALITSFTPITARTDRLQPTQVECGWKVFDSARGPIVQLDTYGSGDRAIPGKTSQTIQIDRKAAEQLITVLRRSFPGL